MERCRLRPACAPVGGRVPLIFGLGCLDDRPTQPPLFRATVFSLLGPLSNLLALFGRADGRRGARLLPRCRRRRSCQCRSRGQNRGPTGPRQIAPPRATVRIQCNASLASPASPVRVNKTPKMCPPRPPTIHDPKTCRPKRPIAPAERGPAKPPSRPVVYPRVYVCDAEQSADSKEP